MTVLYTRVQTKTGPNRTGFMEWSELISKPHYTLQPLAISGQWLGTLLWFLQNDFHYEDNIFTTKHPAGLR